MDLRNAHNRFARSEDGTILVFFAISLAVLLGFVALSFDLGRLGITQTELQSYADSVALAAAGELDGNADSITRAQAAAANLIADRQTFANGTKTLGGSGDYTLTFFSTLPASDTAAITAVTTNPRAAVYVRATIAQRTVPFTFAAAFYGLTGLAPMSNDVNASAVAGFTQYACDVTPLMFCLPSPSYTAEGNKGKMVLLRAGGNNAAWGPGDFGFLDVSSVPADSAGPCANIQSAPQKTACMIAAVDHITQCFAVRGVDTEPGQKVGLNNPAFNVRFDIYKNGGGIDKNDADFAPAPNVIKGIVPKSNGTGNGNGNACITQNEDPSPNTQPLPRDTCFAAGTCSRFGDGDWSAGRASYWSTNHGGTTDPYSSETTRYGYYKAEIAGHGGAASGSRILAAPRAETGRPMCSPNQSTDPDRRVIIAAGIDCAANPINGHATGVPVKEFFKIFLTEPVGVNSTTTPPGFDIWGEIVGTAGGGGAGNSTSGGIFRDVVQLYR